MFLPVKVSFQQPSGYPVTAMSGPSRPPRERSFNSKSGRSGYRRLNGGGRHHRSFGENLHERPQGLLNRVSTAGTE